MFNNPLYLRKVLYNHRVERMVSSELIKDNRWQYEIQTKNEIVCVTNKGNQLMVLVDIIINIPMHHTIKVFLIS